MVLARGIVEIPQKPIPLSFTQAQTITNNHKEKQMLPLPQILTIVITVGTILKETLDTK